VSRFSDSGALGGAPRLRSAGIRAPIAYLVLSHTEPALVARLADRLLRGDERCHVVVDHDRAGPPLDGLPADPRLHRRLSARSGGWGGFGLVQAVLGAFGAVRRELDPDWVVLLSGQDYPAQPLAAVREHLAASGADAHMTVLREVTDGDGEQDRFWHARYFNRWMRLPRAPAMLPEPLRAKRRNLQHRVSMGQRHVFLWSLPRGSGTLVGVRRRRTPFGPGYPCWAAYQWLALSRHALGVLERELSARPELVALYRRSVIPDESLLQTLLLNAPDVRVAQPNLTFQRPAGLGDAHAADLELADLEAIVASGRPFARKMHAGRSLELMAALDARLGLSPAG
jgi:hypothetical protein